MHIMLQSYKVGASYPYICNSISRIFWLFCLVQKYSILSFISVPYNLAVNYQCLLWRKKC